MANLAELMPVLVSGTPPSINLLKEGWPQLSFSEKVEILSILWPKDASTPSRPMASMKGWLGRLGLPNHPSSGGSRGASFAHTRSLSWLRGILSLQVFTLGKTFQGKLLAPSFMTVTNLNRDPSLRQIRWFHSASDTPAKVGTNY
jgi:hypothetical protein